MAVAASAEISDEMQYLIVRALESGLRLGG